MAIHVPLRTAGKALNLPSSSSIVPLASSQVHVVNVRESLEIRRQDSCLNEDMNAYVKTGLWGPVLHTMDCGSEQNEGRRKDEVNPSLGYLIQDSVTNSGFCFVSLMVFFPMLMVFWFSSSFPPLPTLFLCSHSRHWQRFVQLQTEMNLDKNSIFLLLEK